MKKIIFTILLFLFLTCALFATIYNYTWNYPDPYTGETIEFSVTWDDATMLYTVSLYGETRTFTVTEISDGTYTEWLTAIFEGLYSSSSSGSNSLSSGITSIRSAIGNNRTLSSKIRAKVGTTSEEKSKAESSKHMIIVPELAYMNVDDNLQMVHIAAGISYSDADPYALEGVIKPWIDLKMYPEVVPDNNSDSDIGVDAIFHKSSLLSSSLEYGYGGNISLAYISGSSTSFISGLQGDIGFYLLNNLLMSTGLGMNWTFTDSIITSDLAMGASAIYAISEDLFISIYGAVSFLVSVNGITREEVFTDGFLDRGASVGYYFSDTFFLELGINLVDTGGGISIGSSYRF